MLPRRAATRSSAYSKRPKGCRPAAVNVSAMTMLGGVPDQCHEAPQAGCKGQGNQKARDGRLFMRHTVAKTAGSSMATVPVFLERQKA